MRANGQDLATDRPVAVITGASAGVGRATARTLARRGWSVGLIARGEEGLSATRHEAAAHGVSSVAVPTDVADADAVERAAARIEHELGPIDAWVNDAMTSVFGPFLDSRVLTGIRPFGHARREHRYEW